jgi:hypothetical protein
MSENKNGKDRNSLALLHSPAPNTLEKPAVSRLVDTNDPIVAAVLEKWGNVQLWED